MKSLLTIAVIAIVAWFAWQKLSGQSGPPASLEDPVYGEVRVSLEVQDRELEMALFIRASSNADCRGRAAVSWNELFKDCPSCELQEPVCRDELPARYARLFDDVPIPSAYLSATAGNAGERDGRLVVYGLTDEEGLAVCEVLRKQILKSYQGTAHCVTPAGG